MPDTLPPASVSLADHLSNSSTPYLDPLSRVDWQALSLDQYWLPETALSLYGLPAWQRLSDQQRRALSHFEFLHLVSAGLWLESVFMQRLSRSLSSDRRPLSQSVYQLHELREEAGHSLMFLELIRRSGLPRPENRFFRLRWINLLARHVPFDFSLFWIAVLVGEAVPDSFNRYILKHRNEICRTIYDITHIHVVDEARHTSHAGNILQIQFEARASWKRIGLQAAMHALIKQFVEAFFYPQADIYALAGLTNGNDWAKAARGNPHRRQLVSTLVRRTLTLLNELGIGIDIDKLLRN